MRATPRTRALLAEMQGQLLLDDRALDALTRIPPRVRRVVLWVPGTRESAMPAAIRDAFATAMPRVRIIRINYEQSWQIRRSVPDGVRVLGDVFRGIAWLRDRGVRLPDQIFLAGHSQGSWVGTAVLARTDIDSTVISRALFFANPGVNPIHAPGHGPLSSGPIDTVLELSNPQDLITHRPRNIEASLDVVGGPTISRRVVGALVSLAGDPRFVTRITALQLSLRLRGAGNPMNPLDPDPHLYTAEAHAGVKWLAHGHDALPEIERVTAGWA